ncbi:sperm-associated microtubule inner protein 10 [Lepisosteus oculatus]|uniref:sperm-associated microtubule inner protein 10 n=1 Tax=Lepisosteus oculatus TaxID=7918 RepID=UPI00372491B0
MASVATNTDIKGLVHLHLPIFTPKHPMIPKHYVMQWKKDMKNRELILKYLPSFWFWQNAALAKIPHGPHEDSLYWEHQERLCHGQERTGNLDTTTYSFSQSNRKIPITSHYSKYKSSFITGRGVWEKAQL